MIRNLILDWSGTLVDDLSIVLEATNAALRQAGRPAMSTDEFRATFRLPVQEFYDRVLPGVDQALLQEAFHARFAQVQSEVTPLPHAAPFLEFLRAQGCRVFLLTSVPDDYLQRQLDQVGWREWFEALWTGVTDKREALGELLRQQGLQASETLMVGDMEHDVEAAHAAGVQACAVLTGYQVLTDLRAARPERVVEHLGELQDFLAVESRTQGEDGRPLTRRPIPTVGALVERTDGQVLMVRTAKWSNLWGIPGGKIEYGETAETALAREIKEETGLEVLSRRLVMVQDCVESPEFYREEHFLLLNYLCRCAAPAEVTLNHEAQEYRWVSREEALHMALNSPTRRLLEVLGAQGSGT